MTGTICPPDHKHAGNTVCYIAHKCRCDTCRTNATDRARARRRSQLYGTFDTGLVPAGPARDHIKLLQESGMGYKQIATATGLGFTAITSLMYGRKGSKGDPRKGSVLLQILRTKEAAILAIHPHADLLAAGANVNSLGTRRRIQALVTRGWSQQKIANQVGITRANMCIVMKREQCTAGFARRVATLYDQLWNTPPAHEAWRDKIAFNRSVNYAAARRWVAPLGWDNIDTDLVPPLAEPDDSIDEMAVQLVVDGEHMRLTSAERRAATELLWAARWSDSRIAERIGVTPRTILRIRIELGLTAYPQNELIDAIIAA